MGVHGLWRLIEPSGKPVPLETLENKVLAVDVSIWLHQAVKGFQDSKGAPIPNAHLLGIYHRICKLLYFKVKPVFVFDGGVPALKKQTIAKRTQSKIKNQSEADRIQKNLLSTILKHSALNKVLSEKTKAVINDNIQLQNKSKDEKDNLFYLPPVEGDSTISSSEDESSQNESTPLPKWDLHSIDTKSEEFKALPIEVRHEILTDLKETRKQSSWGRLHELPTESNDFSSFQMRRLLKRQSVQQAIEEIEKEMGGHSLSLGELENLLKDQGVISNSELGKRIASDENTRLFLIKNVKEAIEEAKKKEEGKLATIIEEDEKDDNEKPEETEKVKNKADLEYEKDLNKAITLSLQERPSTSAKKTNLELSFLENFNDGDFESDTSDEEIDPKIKFSSAQNYMMEYSGLTPNEIAKILNNKVGKVKETEKEFCKTFKDYSIELSQKKESPPKNKLCKLSEITEKIEKKTDKKDESIENKDYKVVESTVPKENIKKVTEDVKTTSEAENKKREEVEEKKQAIREAVISSTSEEIINQVEETVKISSDSDDSNDFLEVSEVKAKATSTLEIVVNPDEAPEDDLFKDIFEEKECQSTENIIEIAEKNNVSSIKNVEQSKTNDKMNIEEISSEVSKENNIETRRDLERPSKTAEVIKRIEMPKLSIEEMKEMRKNLDQEGKELMSERSAKERLASNITDQMYQEAQELLELFGVPYVIAPMEAEAQCAFLDEQNLTDGTITDDSDIWLFGGKTVYKNFFNNNKHVLEFKAENIKHHFKLTREQMILLALLVGSDYTTGLSGVGPVTALEILAAFPPRTTAEIHLTHPQLLSGLAEFRAWFNGKRTTGPKRLSLRNKLKNISFHENFPNLQVVQAYLDPQVDNSREPFSWGKPNVKALIEYARIKFGWTKVKTEEILKPVLKKLEEKKTQTVIKDYFKDVKTIKAGLSGEKLSDRVKKALKRIGGEEEIEETEEKQQQPRRKKRKNDAEGKPKKENVNANKKTSKEGIKSQRKKLDEPSTSKLDDMNENEASLKHSDQSEQGIDPEIELLKKVKRRSRRRVEEIEEEAKRKLEKLKTELPIKLHKREPILQKQKDKADMLKNKLRAIEVFRKSKQGPGYVKKKPKATRAPKDDAELSESSDDE